MVLPWIPNFQKLFSTPLENVMCDIECKDVGGKHHLGFANDIVLIRDVRLTIKDLPDLPPFFVETFNEI